MFMNRFATKLAEHALPLRHTKTEVLQLNVGKLCNLTCIHCHVNAGPKRKEIMTRATIDQLIDWLAKTDIPTVDLTGGAPEMIPDFKYLVERLKVLMPPRHIIDRCMVASTGRGPPRFDRGRGERGLGRIPQNSGSVSVVVDGGFA